MGRHSDTRNALGNILCTSAVWPYAIFRYVTPGQHVYAPVGVLAFGVAVDEHT